jgi:insertion element IS1 protein InsB
MLMTLKSFQKLVPGDELQTYVKKTDKIWLWTAVDHFKPGILGWVLGDHSAKTFEPLWDSRK